MLKEFGNNISNFSRLKLAETGIILPFVNLEEGNKRRKNMV